MAKYKPVLEPNSFWLQYQGVPATIPGTNLLGQHTLAEGLTNDDWETVIVTDGNLIVRGVNTNHEYADDSGATGWLFNIVEIGVIAWQAQE